MSPALIGVGFHPLSLSLSIDRRTAGYGSVCGFDAIYHCLTNNMINSANMRPYTLLLIIISAGFDYFLYQLSFL